MEPEDNPDATQMSLSVIQNTVSQSKPVQIDDISDYLKKTRHSSILRLGIQSVLCVPLVSNSDVYGAVYLDRRDKKNPFLENDLVFLLSFARQIVQGIKVSQEITFLENKILDEEKLKFEDLRKEFNCEEIIGSSQVLFQVLKTAAKIAPTTASAIILGENGTGKELLARAIHQNSRRKDKPFVAIDCSAIPKDLLESELFGYEAGAFTGATKTKPGKIEMADGGTLFLDEVGELNINLQAKLLRVLQTHEVERLGSVEKKKVDLRIIAATNRDISKMIEESAFREDLYYRLKVIELVMPPLSERKEDIVELVKYFLKKHSEGDKLFTLSNETLEILEHYSWPGNIRELENVILRCIVLAKDKVLKPEDLPSEIIDDSSQSLSVQVGKSLTEAEKEFRKMYILKTLRQASSKTEAAKLLGMNRTHFHRVLSGLGIE
jgi:transcriptional regulator with GAF, ATPase, and Fis domain